MLRPGPDTLGNLLRLVIVIQEKIFELYKIIPHYDGIKLFGKIHRLL